MKNSNFDITAGLRALAASKQKTQFIWIFAGVSAILVGGVYLLRNQNLELESSCNQKDARIVILERNFNDLAILLKQTRQENKDLNEKLRSAQKETENNKSKVS